MSSRDATMPPVRISILPDQAVGTAPDDVAVQGPIEVLDPTFCPLPAGSPEDEVTSSFRIICRPESPSEVVFPGFGRHPTLTGQWCKAAGDVKQVAAKGMLSPITRLHLSQFMDQMAAPQALAARTRLTLEEVRGSGIRPVRPRIERLPLICVQGDFERVIVGLEEDCDISRRDFFNWPKRINAGFSAQAPATDQVLVMSFLALYFWMKGGVDLVEGRLYKEFFRAYPGRFSRADLRGARLENLMADNFRASGSILHGAFFSCAELPGSNFSEAMGIEATFSMAQLQGSSFQGARLVSSDFLDTDLSGADLRDALFNGCRMEGINLEGAVLDNANFINMVIGRWILDANLNGARFHRCSFTEGISAATLVGRGAVVNPVPPVR